MDLGAIILQLAWRFRFSILLVLTIIVGSFAVRYMLHQHDELRQAGEAIATAQRINGDMAKAMNRLEAARAFSEAALAQRVARKTKEADQLGALVQYITAQERTNACAASPSVRALLDRLRQPGSTAQ